MPLIMRPQERIMIDVSKKDQIKLSQIADTAIIVHFDTSYNYTIDNLSGLSFTKKYVFIPKRKEDDKHYIESLLQFDLKGNLITQIGLKSKITKRYLRINKRQCLQNKNQIIIDYDNGCAIFDLSSNLNQFIEGLDLGEYQTIYNNKKWEVETSLNFEIGSIQYNLVSTDIVSGKKDTAFTFLRFMDTESKKNKSGLIHGFPRYSISNNMLMVAIHDLLLKVDMSNNVTPLFQFDYKNDDFFVYRDIFYSFRFVSKNWIFHGYCNKSFSTRFIYLLNYKSKISYNIPVSETYDEEPHSWIIDDIFNTGNVFLRNTNMEGYCYFIKNKNDFLNLTSNSKNWADKVLILVKLKE